MSTCGECGAELQRCPMGCGELRCSDECNPHDAVEHERDHRDAEDEEYWQRKRDLDEEFGRH